MTTKPPAVVATWRTRSRGVGANRLRAVRLCAVLSVLATTLGVVGAVSAAASTRPSMNVRSLAVALERPNARPERAVSDVSTFCADAEKSEKSSATPTPSDTAAYLKNAFNEMKADEALVLGITPSQLKSDWQTIFAYTTKIYNALAAVNYNYAKLKPSSFTALLAGSKSVAAAGEAISAYLKKYCGISN